MSAELVLVVVAAFSAVLAAVMATLVWSQSRKNGSGQDSSLAAQNLERTELVAVQVQTGNQVQAERIHDLREVVDRRLMALDEQSRNDFARRNKSDGEARLELQTTLTERLVQMESKLGEVEKSLNKGLDQLRTTNATELEKIRNEVAEKLQARLKQSLDENAKKIEELKDSTNKHQEKLKESMRQELEKVRANNVEQLEKMRATVDEKLQGTLEKRLGESFKLVSERLEQVQRGLGEMQTLATDVGGLKRVLTNVKSRGTWGEVQLSRQLEDILAPDQFEQNVQIKTNSGERVEFAVRLPGRDEDGVVLLPIDSKFPQESYERLLGAQESAEPTELAAATKELERALRGEAKRISSKYIDPPRSTDFAIMYLPTEGLFAEAIRIPGLASSLQSSERVMLTGPTTLMSLLNSLQMGFRTLAIEKRSSEVWQVLAAAKEEFAKYGGVMDKLKKQLKTAQNTVEQVEVRTRVINRSLRDVESLDSDRPLGLLEVDLGAESLLLEDASLNED